VTRGHRVDITAAAIVILGVVAAGVAAIRLRPVPEVTIAGAVLVNNKDPRKQVPIPDAEITARSGPATGECKSDSTGFFQLTFKPSIRLGQFVTLRAERAGYEPFEITKPARDGIWVIGMTPVPTTARSDAATQAIVISDVRLRYSVKTTTTMNVGPFGKMFEVPGTNGVPCGERPPCSPDGKWKANVVSLSLDAGEGNAFSDLRVSCIAGPCSFAEREPTQWAKSGRVAKVAAFGWASTTTFLVEAQVVRTNPTVLLRQSYPIVFGQTMNFTLPAGAEGPSIEASLNKTDIVFPLGPDLRLSWADCTVKVDADQSKLIRCELKPGYRFQGSGS